MIIAKPFYTTLHFDVNNNENNYHLTTLITTSCENCPEIVEMLLQRDDIDVNLQDLSCFTSLSEAVKKRNKKNS